MKRIAIAMGLVLLLGLGLGLSQLAASESGEVVTLTTVSDTGETVRTRLWVVDHDGRQWLRSGQPDSGWHTRLTANSAVAVERRGESAEYRAVPVPDARTDINRLMRAKYGWADAYIDFLFDVGDALPIRLDPR